MSKFDIPLFDVKSNFMLWQSMIQDFLMQQGLDLALKENKSNGTSDKDWDRLQKMTISTIRLALAPEIEYNVLTETTPTKL